MNRGPPKYQADELPIELSRLSFGVILYWLFNVITAHAKVLKIALRKMWGNIEDSIQAYCILTVTYVSIGMFKLATVTYLCLCVENNIK